MAFVDFFGNFVRKKDVYLKYSTNEQWTGEYWIDGHKIYQVSYNRYDVVLTLWYTKTTG